MIKQTGYAPVNGLNMYYEVYGEGDVPLVLVHGGGSNIETSFGMLLPLLEGCGKVIAVELQAHGRTSDRDAPETFKQDAEDVAGLLQYLKIGKANILGFSNGGTTTLELAAAHPELINKIVVVAANYRRDGMMAGLFDGLAQAMIADMPEALRQAYLKVSNNNHAGLQVMFEKDRDRMLHFEDIADELLAGIQAPALLIVGDRDVMTVEHTIAMTRLIPDAKLMVLPGAHGSYIGEMGMGNGVLPKVTAMMVEDFLKG